MILVIDYGMGNLRSIEKALRAAGADFKVSHNKSDITSAESLLLPGVGSFGEGMQSLKKLGLIEPIKAAVLESKTPILGVCLGMQLLFKTSEEGGAAGLGLIDGKVNKFSFSGGANLKVPHMGWNDVFGQDMKTIPLFKDIAEHTNFYFVHSYHAVLEETIPHALTTYGYDFVSAVQKNNIFGTQFHPEKSQKKGIEMLKNFVSISKKC